MRYKHKVRGDKFGILSQNLSKTEKFQEKISANMKAKDTFHNPVIFNELTLKGFKTRFMNKMVRFYPKMMMMSLYLFPIQDGAEKSFGLTEGHLSFLLNSYGNQLFFYPKALLRNNWLPNLCFKNGRKISIILSDVKNPVIKILGIFCSALFIYLSKN